MTFESYGYRYRIFAACTALAATILFIAVLATPTPRKTQINQIVGFELKLTAAPKQSMPATPALKRQVKFPHYHNQIIRVLSSKTKKAPSAEKDKSTNEQNEPQGSNSSLEQPNPRLNNAFSPVLNNNSIVSDAVIKSAIAQSKSKFQQLAEESGQTLPDVSIGTTERLSLGIKRAAKADCLASNANATLLSLRKIISDALSGTCK